MRYLAGGLKQGGALNLIANLAVAPAFLLLMAAALVVFLLMSRSDGRRRSQRA